MKLSSVLCASIIALASLALTADGAFAAHFSNNNQRSDPYKLRANDLNGEKDCNSKGGKVYTDKEGTKTCNLTGTATPAPSGIAIDLVIPGNATPAPAEATNLHYHGTHTSPEDCTKEGSATRGAGDGKASVYARTNSEGGVWKAPAGTEATHCENGNGKAGTTALEKKDAEALSLSTKTNTPAAASPPPKLN